MKVIDGDGHVFEDNEELGKFLPDDLRRIAPADRWFPPLDHFHSFIGQTPPGSFRRDTKVDEWKQFMDDLGIEQAVLSTTAVLAFGRCPIPTTPSPPAAPTTTGCRDVPGVQSPLRGHGAHPDAGARGSGRGAAALRDGAGHARRDAERG